MNDETTIQSAKTSGRDAEIKTVDVITAAGFVTLLFVPLLGLLLGSTPTVSNIEQRALAPWPSVEIDAKALNRLPRRTARAFEDRMGFRVDLIRAQAWSEATLFGTSPTSKLIIGKEGWLFYGDANAVAHQRRVKPLGPRALQRWLSVLEARNDWLADRGVAFLLVLVPDKHLMYPEYLPNSHVAAIGTHPIEQLSAALARRGTVPFVDLRDTLERAKQSERVYHRTDTHWNDVGAYAAYREILRAAGELLPELADAAPVAVSERRFNSPGLGLAHIVGLARSYPEEMILLEPLHPRAAIPIERRAGYDDRVLRQLPIGLGTGRLDQPRAVIFRDSFANALVPYLSEHFSRVVWVWDRDVVPEFVDREAPDLVIQEIVGRFLPRRPRAPAEFAPSSTALPE